jgi:hypothetical protein
MRTPICYVIMAMVMGGTQAHAGALCDAAAAAVPDLACAEAPLGVALAPDHARAVQLAMLGQAGEARFRRHFGRDTPRYAIIEMAGEATTLEQTRALSAVGFRRTLHWLSQAAYVDAMVDAAARGAEEAARARGLQNGPAASARSAAIAAIQPRLTAFALNEMEAGVVPHEIGHGWYVETFWPGVAMDRRGHYGGPGPDWLDETAAILMESGDLAQQRRAQFHDIYLGRGLGPLASHPIADLLDLQTFLRRDHPEHALNADARSERPRSDGPGVVVLTGPAIGQRGRSAIFYLQGRMFADFLIDRSGDAAVFGALGDAFARGDTIESWLAQHGAARGLAEAVPELEQQWRDWLAARFGSPRS